MLAALLLGAALGLPAILELVLALGQKTAQRALAVWFWADSRQQISGLSLALMALLLALAVNVGVGTMVETFSRTFIIWLDGRLAADVYINATDDAQATEIKAWLRQRPEVQAILPGGRADTEIDGAPVEILGLPDHALYRDRWPLLQSERQRLDPSADRRCRFHQRAIGEAFETRCRRSHRRAGAGRQLDARSGRHLRRLRQSEGADRGQFRGADPALPGHSANAPRPARHARRGSGADCGAAGQVRTRWPQPAGSGHVESRFDADLQPDLCRDGGAERLHPRRGRRRTADQPLDSRQFPPAAARAAMGHGGHAAKARRHRIR